jgi:hypothetical protein
MRICRLGPLEIVCDPGRRWSFFVVDYAWNELVATARSAREAYKIASQVVRSLNRSCRDKGELAAGWDSTP